MIKVGIGPIVKEWLVTWMPNQFPLDFKTITDSSSETLKYFMLRFKRNQSNILREVLEVQKVIWVISIAIWKQGAMSPNKCFFQTNLTESCFEQDWEYFQWWTQKIFLRIPLTGLKAKFSEVQFRCLVCSIYRVSKKLSYHGIIRQFLNFFGS